ncbi:mucin-17-like [Bufo gargarizans]|uniref:mucin-17-like n=1 Tax=Bufo gargarizans TaxID=30331 RepID=UPI001CF2D99C|nr:mucin-17-like [Bufo gargarizans]XP_044135036.1 mucin-17-like [Bufo gargarizans]XP_044135041.1 mucin-17-like [Bufo gargarizans]XP_044135042.1 mucin-17-like [Bufo gargarizans]
MDSSTSGKSKGGTPTRPLTSRPSLSRSTKTGGSTPSPKVATEIPRPASSRGGGPVSKPTLTKATTAVKEANAAKSNAVRTVAASPIKSKTVTHRDPASAMKPSAKQTTRPQNGEKGAQQTASPLVIKKEAAKKNAEGPQLDKPKSGQERGNTTPSKQNATVKREVGKPPEHGSVPKDKTVCLRPESSTSVPSKPLATASSPSKTLKANSLSHKPKQIVPPPEKPVNNTSLSTKAAKSPVAATRSSVITSTAAKPIRTTSPLVKAPRPTPASIKPVTKTPTSPVKPVNTPSVPPKLRNATPAKPPGNTVSSSNQGKVGKRLSTTTKATSVSAKQVNNLPTAIKSVKSSVLAHKSVKECAEATPVVNQVSPILTSESQQIINSEVENVDIDKNDNIAVLEKPQEPVIVAEEVVVITVNNDTENAMLDNAKIGGGLLKESALPLETNESISPAEEISVETNSQDEETQILVSLDQGVKSPTKQVTPLEEEFSPSVEDEPSSESSIVSAEHVQEQPNVPSEHLAETLMSPLEETYCTMEASKPFETQQNVPIEDLPNELRSPLELAIPSAGPDKALEVESTKELKEDTTSSEQPVNNISDGVHISIKTLDDDDTASPIKPSNETVEPVIEETRYLDEEHIVYMDRGTHSNQSERMPIKPLDEDTFTADGVEPLEDVVTSSLEQVTPLEEEAVLSEDELEPVEHKSALLEEEYKNSPNTLDQLEVSPLDPENPLELLTSSTEELTPSEELELLKDEKQTLQERISSSQHLDMTETEDKMDIAKPTEIGAISMDPFICSKEEINTSVKHFGETIINTESKTSLEKKIHLNEILQSSYEVVKHSEEGITSSLDLLQSSVGKARSLEEGAETLQSSAAEGSSYQEDAVLSVEPLQYSIQEVKLLEKVPLSSVEPLQSLGEVLQSPQEDKIFLMEALQVSVGDIRSSEEEPMLLVEPLQTSVKEVKLSEKEPLSVEFFHSLVDANQSSQEHPMSEELQQPAVEEVKSSQVDRMLSKEPPCSSGEADRNVGGEHTSSLVLLQSSLEPLDPLAENLLCSIDPLTQTKESITSLKEATTLEGSQSPVQLQDLSQNVPLENTKDVQDELIEEEGDASLEKKGEEVLLMEQQGHVIEEGNSIIETLQYEAKMLGSSTAESSENVEQTNKAANIHPEDFHENIPVGSKLFEEPLIMMHEPDHGPAKHRIAAEKQLDSAYVEVEDISNPIKVDQSVQESVLLPEEPLASRDEFKTISVEAVDYPEKPIKSSLEQVKCADYDEEATKPSIHELMDYREYLITSPEKSLDTVMFSTSRDLDAFSSETVDIYSIESALPNYQENLGKLEPAKPLTSEDYASETLVEQHVNKPLVSDLEKSIDSDFYVTMDTTEHVRNLSTNQFIGKDIEEIKPSTTEVVCVSEEPILFTDEESLEPLDKSTDVLEQYNPIEILEQTKPVEAKPATEVSFSDESTSISHTETSSPEHTFSPASNTISVLPTQQNVEVSKTSDLHPLQNEHPSDHPQDTERESWVLVKMDELSDFKEEPEERPLRPASLNQEAEVQDEQKAEEEQMERASVCSTLSDPQLAAKSSSETSTPEELRTYEDSSSGVESHSDDAATSPQTTLTPDPDLGIHMGQEEGTETPAGTPASNNKRVPPPLQIVDIEGQSQSTSPCGIFESADNEQIVRKKEVTTSSESREHDYEETPKERGAQRGNDD